ncbi:hypothetical protein D3C80_1477030 [compost metagenome]
MISTRDHFDHQQIPEIIKQVLQAFVSTLAFLHQLLYQFQEPAHITFQNGRCQAGKLFGRDPPSHAQHLLISYIAVCKGGYLIKYTERITHPPIGETGDILQSICIRSNALFLTDLSEPTALLLQRYTAEVKALAA